MRSYREVGPAAEVHHGPAAVARDDGVGGQVRDQLHLELVLREHLQPLLARHLDVAVHVACERAKFVTGFSQWVKGQAQGLEPGAFKLWVNWIQLVQAPHLDALERLLLLDDLLHALLNALALVVGQRALAQEAVIVEPLFVGLALFTTLFCSQYTS